jgi:hypothetical protein
LFVPTASNTTTTAATIQEALDQGKDVVLTPGLYYLDRPLVLSHPHQVLLGLGLATLVAPTSGRRTCLVVRAFVPGVRVAGIMLEASARKRNSSMTDNNTPNDDDDNNDDDAALLEWGESGDPGDAQHPGAMFDVFVRVGGAAGAAAATADSSSSSTSSSHRSNYHVAAMMRIHSGHVIGDNVWLWRADHAALGPNETANYPHISNKYWQTEADEYVTRRGLEVTGNDVTMYGLAVEHATEDQTVWTGDRGTVLFYQCEFPYCVTSAFADAEYRGYRIGNDVTEHTLVAPGIYSNFRHAAVHVRTAIQHPPNQPGIHVVHPFTVRLDNQGSIRSIVNGIGGAAEVQGRPSRLL